MILEGIGEDPKREGLLKTPERVARMYAELLAGLHEDGSNIMATTFEESSKEMIVVKDISLVSLCEHHFLPFIGKAHVAYIPHDRVVGLSKIARVVEHFARRPQIQERLTRQIADYIDEAIHPLGVAVLIESEHSCMTMRGVRKPGAKMVTSHLKGVFHKQSTRDEFMSIVTNPVRY